MIARRKDNIDKLYPSYFTLYLKNSKVRICATYYIDLPAELYKFIINICTKINKGESVNFDYEWKCFLNNKKDLLMIKDEPIAEVKLNNISNKKYNYKITMKVNWASFLKKLENSAEEAFKDVFNKHKNATVIAFYAGLWKNLERLYGTRPFPNDLIKSGNPNFKRLIELTGDLQEITQIKDDIFSIIDCMTKELVRRYHISKVEKEILQYIVQKITIPLTQIITSIEDGNLTAAYVSIRNSLENFVRFYFYVTRAEENPEIFTKLDSKLYKRNKGYIVYFVWLFLALEATYEGDPEKRKNKKLLSNKVRDWQENFLKSNNNIVTLVNKIRSLAYLNNISDEDLENLAEEAKNYNIPLLKITTCTIKCLNNDLARLYSICSQVIHSPYTQLPFYSLLELKFFKHILKKYKESIENMVKD